MKTLFTTLLICTLAMASLSFAKTSDIITASGRIVTINDHSITIATKKDEHKSFFITSHTKIKLDGVVTKIDKVPAGIDATVLRSTEHPKDAKEIDATTITISGAKGS